jgi:uncharacterized repeat protein (TIGR03803 family)
MKIRRSNRQPSSAVLKVAIQAIAIALFSYSTSQRVQAQTESVLYSFTGGNDGAQPYAGLARDPQGNFYGTTVHGGGSLACTNGCGTVYRVTRSGAETVVYGFGGNTDGAMPYGGVVRNVAGSLLGETAFGGFFAGTLFKVDPHGQESLLHVFQGSNNGDGAGAYSSLVPDPQGNFYGTTFSGGSQCAAFGGCGTVFRLTNEGIETVLYSFAGGTDGAFPFAQLCRKEKNLYGTTTAGGSYGQGTMFKLSASGAETIVHSFTGGSDGGIPVAGLVSDNHGNLYGTASTGGAYGHGTVFEVTAAGQFIVLHSFQGNPDGALPAATLVLGNKGALFGTTNSGGMFDAGTVFEITPAGVEKVLYSFSGGSDGGHPNSGLLVDGSHLFGTTFDGGTAGLGTVFSLQLP